MNQAQLIHKHTTSNICININIGIYIYPNSPIALQHREDHCCLVNTGTASYAYLLSETQPSLLFFVYTKQNNSVLWEYKHTRHNTINISFYRYWGVNISSLCQIGYFFLPPTPPDVIFHSFWASPSPHAVLIGCYEN